MSMDSYEEDPVRTIGRPLWEAKTELELLEGIRAILEGFLHRNIGTRNILLPLQAQPAAGEEGFLIDSKFSHTNHPILSPRDIKCKGEPERVGIPEPGDHRATLDRDLEQRNRLLLDPDVSARWGVETLVCVSALEHSAWTDHRRGKVRGTYQFMAYELLEATFTELCSAPNPPQYRVYLVGPPVQRRPSLRFFAAQPRSEAPASQRCSARFSLCSEWDF
ncbi:hypothetical protein HWV62_41910 [Athelia sp. TMB]|nr:hypothetical protein HWV62_41910 [Athelia sp. TMB]